MDDIARKSEQNTERTMESQFRGENTEKKVSEECPKF